MKLFFRLMIFASLLAFAACNVSDEGGGIAADPECTEDSCPANATCIDNGSALACECNEGYVGEDCEGCASGFQDNDSNGTCEASCATSDLNCGSNGTCVDSSGTASCDCDPGYTGATCSECAEGLQDDDMDGVCVEDCTAAALDCGANGMCSTATGAPACECLEGYAGEDCDICADGYQDNDMNGTCEAECATSGLDCGDNGTCEDMSGTAVCACETGYAGETCGECAPEYQDNDMDGVCAENCAEAALMCTNQTVCTDDTGMATCTCGPGDPCVDCVDTEQDEDGNGVCTAPCGVDTAWWNNDFRNRLALSINPSGDLSTGAAVSVRFDHAAEVLAGRSLASGDDVRVVFVDSDGNATELARTVEGDGWDTDNALVTLALQQNVAAGTSQSGYWLYWNNTAAASPPVTTFPAPPEWAVSDDDQRTLECQRRRGGFYSIQLRQLAPNSNQYEIYANEHTGDGSSFGRIVVRDMAGNEILRREYGELGGSCCSPVVDGDRAQTVTINQRQFTVELTTREFSSTVRYFGCAGFGTSNPTLEGSTTRAYTVRNVDRPTMNSCDRGTP